MLLFRCVMYAHAFQIPPLGMLRFVARVGLATLADIATCFPGLSATAVICHGCDPHRNPAREDREEPGLMVLLAAMEVGQVSGQLPRAGRRRANATWHAPRPIVRRQARSVGRLTRSSVLRDNRRLLSPRGSQIWVLLLPIQHSPNVTVFVLFLEKYVALLHFALLHVPLHAHRGRWSVRHDEGL